MSPMYPCPDQRSTSKIFRDAITGAPIMPAVTLNRPRLSATAFAEWIRGILDRGGIAVDGLDPDDDLDDDEAADRSPPPPTAEYRRPAPSKPSRAAGFTRDECFRAYGLKPTSAAPAA